MGAPPLDVTVVIATYGDPQWQDLARERALPSIPEGVPRQMAHSLATLAESRNLGLFAAATEYVCFLDADDALTPGYFDAIARADADLRAPAVQYVSPAGDVQEPRMPRVVGHDHDCKGGCLEDGNWAVIGTVARTALLREVGGFRDLPLWEDWDLWLRCWRADATITAVPDAVYRAYDRPMSRNRSGGRDTRQRAWERVVG